MRAFSLQREIGIALIPIEVVLGPCISAAGIGDRDQVAGVRQEDSFATLQGRCLISLRVI
ncbi:hypothetical protein D3C75_1368440 [compost metagenome]